MNIQKRYESILKLDSNKRYEFSVSTIAESEEVFFLSNEGLIILSDSNDNKFIPIWPEREFAEAYKDQNRKETIVKVTLEELIFGTVPDLLNKNIKLAIFPVLK
ncbi:DUF2750 domain-containing protein [Psychrobacter sp. FDAARGOS_221]|uniref:DUF2750 domain-containing protein n=1 Tax=Psychrobacter sp. FDAARGOS_221 TaxID=1975705 RepID=UPI000BB573E5|nr:DUF2750 domain-containing protein [Psychrobacter sp. FDAARGOS_221]PNK61508.1 DUF2750 domain-containing protein [Psychrobacter sp. FDAARGOS_221]